MDADVTRRALESAVVEGMARAEKSVMQYGVDDCALWVADIQRDVLGYDPAAHVRGRYKTRLGALRVTGAAGLLGQVRGIARRHKWKRIDPATAKPGDTGLAWTLIEVPHVFWTEDDDGNRVQERGKREVATLATVICRSPGWFVGRNTGGFTAMRADKVAVAWSVLDDVAAPEVPDYARSFLYPKPYQFAGLRLPAANHEPISIGLAILSAVGITGASTLVAGIVGSLALATLSIGVSLVASLLRPQAGASLDTNMSNAQSVQAVQITERQPIPIKRVIVGSAYVGGALCFEKVTPPKLTMGVLFNYGEVTAVDKVFCGTNELAFSAIAPDTILTPIAVDGQPNYPAKLRMSLRYGSLTQAADPLAIANYPEVGANFRQAGNATAFYEFGFGANQTEFIALWGQVSRPNMYLVVRGVKCYDPRDPTQSLADEATWKWTNNATLVQAFYLTRTWGGRISTHKIRWDKIAISADYDDELIGCNDGTMIKRHTIDGVITLNQRPFDVMQDLLAANRAMVLESGGMMWIESSKPRTSIVTIHDRILASGIKYQAARAKKDLVNKLQVRFVSPEQEYQLADGPVREDTDWQAADGEVLPATLALKYTQDHRRAQRLQKLFMLSSRLGRTITCSVDIALMAIAEDELVGSVVTMSSELFSKANGYYLVTAVGFSDDCTTLSLALTEYDPTLESQWNSEVDEQPFELSVAA